MNTSIEDRSHPHKKGQEGPVFYGKGQEGSIVFHIDHKGVATITLNRPDKFNAFDDDMIDALSEIFNHIASDNTLRIMVLTGAGKHFCAGGDLSWMKRMAQYSYEENLEDAKRLAKMFQQLNTLPIPTIAKVQGAAFGGGVGLASCCDMVVASTGATFALSEVKIGLIPATISPYVIDAIGRRAARRYCLTGERFNAQKAQTLGLVSEVVEKNDLDTAVEGLIQSILENGPNAVQHAKTLIFDMGHGPMDTKRLETTSERIAKIRVSSEGQEGLAAFMEKRQPSWRIP